jgi:hypothetical protein
VRRFSADTNKERPTILPVNTVALAPEFNLLNTKVKVVSDQIIVPDENRAEQGIRLEDIKSSGMRNRLGPGQASLTANNNPESSAISKWE